MEATREMLQSAVAGLRAIAAEASAATAEAAPLADQKKELTAKVRNAVAYVVSLAYFQSVGAETLKKLIGAATLKASGDVLKVRLSEVNKIRRLHPNFATLAEGWATGQDRAFDPELGGYSVGRALKDVTVPSDPIAAVEKAVTKALELGADVAELQDRVTVAVRQWEVEQEFLAEQSGEPVEKVA